MLLGFDLVAASRLARPAIQSVCSTFWLSRCGPDGYVLLGAVIHTYTGNMLAQTCKHKKPLMVNAFQACFCSCANTSTLETSASLDSWHTCNVKWNESSKWTSQVFKTLLFLIYGYKNYKKHTFVCFAFKSVNCHGPAWPQALPELWWVRMCYDLVISQWCRQILCLSWIPFAARDTY